MQFKKVFDNIIDLETIKRIISQSEIKVVSFDIFDTLLLRPSFEPKDIFHIVASKVDKKYKIDFISMRWNAEAELKSNDLNIKDIYFYIQKKYNLSNEITNNLMNEEMACEKHFLHVRDDIKEIYDYAVTLGKKVIATSDMYLPSNFLYDVLKSKGYNKIDSVIVSNEFHKRKDNNGELFDVVLSKYSIKEYELFHIGDNRHSDYVQAINKGIIAVHYPSIRDIVFSNDCIYSKVWLYNENHTKISEDPFSRILLGYLLQSNFKNRKMYSGRKVFNNIFDFARLGLSPLLFYLAFSIATSDEIQKKYNKVHFASRDGYLPMQAYNTLAQYITVIPSEYVYCGRRAYYCLIYENFYDFLNKELFSVEKYPFVCIIRAFITDHSLQKKILNGLQDDILNIDFKQHKNICIAKLEPFSREIDEFYQKKRLNTIKYYESVFTNTDNVIFDAGYSGSIGAAFAALQNKKVNKIYMWETEKNQKRDKKYGTNTILLMNDPMPMPIHLAYEELFSPLEGGVLDFIDNKPIFESLSFSEGMIDIYKNIHKTCIDTIVELCEFFGDYLSNLRFYDTTAIQRCIFYAFMDSPYEEARLFKDVFFSDPVGNTNTSLTEKLYQNMPLSTVFSKTGFENPNLCIQYTTTTSNKMNVGIHIHMYYVDLADELLVYFTKFPCKFDLFITVVTSNNITTINSLFNNKVIPNLNKCLIIKVKNRGRDVAPWLVLTKSYQSDYDIFCHLHTKKSLHSEYGDLWRQYLYRNLLDSKAVSDTISLFSDHPTLGCVFPQPFPPLKQLCISSNISQYGEFGEIHIINNLLQKMGINRFYNRSDLLFSEGTMMWYRPKALKKLFDLNLTFEDFPEEPIGVGGTLAHVIERLPGIICEESGYKVKMYTPYPYKYSIAHKYSNTCTEITYNFIHNNKKIVKILLLKYRILSKLTFGKRRLHYKNKKKELKEILKNI